MEIKFQKTLSYDPEFQAQVVKEGGDKDLLHIWIMKSRDANGSLYYDKQNQHVPIDVIKRAATKFMKGDRVIKDRHSGKNLDGLVVHSMVFDKEKEPGGISAQQEGWYGSIEFPDEIMELYRTGARKHVSIGGQGTFIPTGAPVAKADDPQFFVKTGDPINMDTEKKEWEFGVWKDLTINEISAVPIGAQDPGFKAIISKEGDVEMTISKEDLEKAVKEAAEKATKEATEKAAADTAKALENAMSMTDAEKEFMKGLDEAEKAKFMEDDKDTRKKKMDDAKKALEEAATKSGEFVSKADFEKVQKQLEDLEKAKAEKEGEVARKEFIEKELGSIEGKPSVKDAIAKTALAIEDETARKEFIQSFKSADGIVKLGKEAQGTEDGGEPKTMTTKEYAEALDLKVKAKTAKGMDVGSAVAEAEAELDKLV